MKLVFATNNENKLKEIQAAINDTYIIQNLKDIHCHEDIPETGETLEANALQKARYIYEKFGLNCFADDTGLEIDALGGEPGVYSARYAGPQRDSGDNMTKVLQHLEGNKNRAARFRTVIALIIDGQEWLFEGKVEGVILNERAGHDGFGYDPIFRPNGYTLSFAQMTINDKNTISHRGRAVQKLIQFLKAL